MDNSLGKRVKRVFDESGRKGDLMLTNVPLTFPSVGSIMEFNMQTMTSQARIMFSMFQSGQRMTELIWMNALLYKVSR